ncbi:Outer membrane protein beta-barrel domain-containing protein [Tangfeifania diversioriginum]|uniref:Outer membrane protein beta-barrel domain-containing protein n=1 Tax=Tangfeifania diversioriginum TaxID=1168035 RepID=A0A1M6G935_9BACT|nr:outer membrane beta-barrel protein [Tangfeifania diversioriginum]SHJ06428.1 Outer membrane protein beta-barrel domain-containing protein [Tangfeifania diversioriginum]
MKNRLTIIIGFIIFSLMNLNAQNINLGIKTGAGIAKTNFTNIPDIDSNSDIFSSNFSYSINGTLNYRINQLFGFSVEPGIIKQGWISNKENNNENKINLYYFQLSSFLDFYLSDKLFFSIGPEVDYLVNAKNKTTSNSEEITDLFRKFGLSGMTGITYNIFDIYDIGFKFSHGLTKISDELLWVADDDINTIKLRGYNQSFQFFIKFRIKNLR